VSAINLTTKSTERLFDLDFVRAIACCLVILFHASSDYVSKLDVNATNWWVSNIYNSLSCCGVPLFIMLSGALMFDRDMNEFPLKRRLLKIAMLYLMASALYAIYHIFWSEDFDLKPFLINTINGESEYHLWYLYLIISLYLITPIISGVQNLSSRKIFAIISGILVLHNICIYADHFSGLEIRFLYFKDDLWAYISYYIFGYLAYRRWLSSWQKSKSAYFYSMLLWLLSLVSIILLTGFFSIAKHEYIGEFFYENHNLLVGVMSSSLFVLLLLLADRVRAKYRSIFSMIAGASLGIYIIHTAALEKSDEYLMTFFDEYLSANWLGLRILVHTVLAFSISFMIIFSIRRFNPIRNLV
jgi:surface polysaccharide O-acyltransferase-like enzyme